MTKLSKPLIIVNFKVYSEAEGRRASDIAKMCQDVSDASGITIAAAPPMTELGAVARSVNIPVFSQNADPHSSGSSTGWVTPSMIKAAGAVGTLINHSEHRQSMDAIAKTVELCRACGLLTVVCADTAKAAEEIASLHPDMIAVEPPELIGGNVSVTDADPGIVERTVRSVKAVDSKISVLCGAGIKTGKDVKKALELGAEGVLLASGVVRAKDPKAALLDLVKFL